MNSNSRTAIYCVAVGAISVILSLFYFSYQQSNDAYAVAQENRERVAVVEAQFREFSGEIRSRLDELRADVKQLLREQRK